MSYKNGWNKSVLTLSFFFICSSFLTSSALFSQSSSAENWREFKGSSDRNGSTKESDIKMPLKVVWKYTPEGKTNGFVDWGPVAANGKVFTSDGLNHVLALDANSGKVLWNKQLISNVFSETLSEDLSLLFVTVAITTKPSSTLFALNPETGDIVWENMINNQPAVGGMEGAPAIDASYIYAPYLQFEGKSGVAAYEVKTGKLKWQWSVDKYSPYTPVSLANGLLYIGFENKSLVCLQASTGHVVWSQTALTDLPYGAPTVYRDKVLLGAGKTFYAFDAKNGAIIWQQTLESEAGHSSASAYKDNVYFGTRGSNVYSLRIADGTIEWKADTQKGPIESSPVVDKKKHLIFLGTEENNFLVLDAKSGKIKQTLHLSDDQRGVWKAAPALYNGKVYIGSLDRNFYALE